MISICHSRTLAENWQISQNLAMLLELSPMSSIKERLAELEQKELLVESTEKYTIETNIDPYGQHLHHTGSLKLFEKVRTHIFEEHGMPAKMMAEEHGLWGFVYEISVRYSGQIAKGAEVEVTSRIFLSRPALLSFHQTINIDGQDLVEAVVGVALVNRDGKPVIIPDWILNNLRPPESS